ncbi:MAG: hypothetical protein K0R29_405 [Pseudobdellovibrio sp.]|jgi:hypothetical protein|nr:hypothetical protein [Pseudobdellovibrio sp.]
MKKNILLMASVLLLGFAVQSHEGHDHNGPAGVQAPKGGIIKGNEDTYVEVVSRGKDLKVYLYDKDLKPVDPKSYNVSAKVQLPKVKKAEDLALTLKDNVLEATYDAKKAHRYTLHLSLKSPKEEHADTLKYTIEPKK